MYNVWQYLSSLVNILSNVESLLPSWVDRDFKKVPRSGGLGAGAGGPGAAAAGGAGARGGGAPRGRGAAPGRARGGVAARGEEAGTFHFTTKADF